MYVTRTAAVVRVHLEPPEFYLLTEMLKDLAAGLAALGPGDEVWDRLHPAAYEDAEASAEFRAMAEDDIDRLRAECVAHCQTDLAAGGTEVTLADGAALDRWLRTINDLRLGQGIRIGVRADDDPDDPQYEGNASREVYSWLTVLQDALVTAAMP